MASGLYNFVAGAKPTATQWNDFIGKQVVGVYTSNTDRDTQLATAKRDGTFAYMTDAPKRLMRYNGSIWLYVYSEWVAFTPTWTNVTVGTGGAAANAGFYRYVGQDMEIQIRTVLGTSGASVSNGVSFAIPDSQSVTGVFSGGIATYVNTGVREWGGFCRAILGQTSVTLLQNESGTGDIGTSNPFAFGAGSEIRVLWKGTVD